MEKFDEETLSSWVKNPDNIEQYNSTYELSVSNPEKFWKLRANEILSWDKPFEKALQGNIQDGTDRWFDSGYINACYNCVDRHAKSKPENLAIIWTNESKTESRYISYKRLYEQVCLFANGLKSLSCEKGDVVCIYMPMIPEAIIAMLACARIGVTHSVVFGGFSADALGARVKDARAKVIITADQTTRSGKVINLKEQADLSVRDYHLEHMVIVKNKGNLIDLTDGRDIWYSDLMSEASDECAPISVESNHPLFMLYTSGSTGKPKGIVHSTGGYLCYATSTFNSIFNVNSNDIFWCTADIGWITGHSYLVYGPLSSGASIFMIEGNPMYPCPNEFAKTIDDYKISILYTAPTLIRTLMSHGDKSLQGTTRKTLRLLGSVGEPINPAAWRWYKESFGNNQAAIVDTWWQTETGGIMISPHPAEKQKPGSAMKPSWGVDAKVISDDGTTLRKGSIGLLAIKGTWPGKMLTIHNDHHRYIDTYLSKYPGYYLTGDGANIDNDGDIWVTGRVDDVMNVSGHRISTSEIESVLVSHENVAEAAVISTPDKITGEAIHAFVQTVQGALTNDSLKENLVSLVKKDIGSFAKPKKIYIVPELPKTRSGKIMRRVLRKLLLNQQDELGDLSTLAEAQSITRIISSIEDTTS